MNMENEILNYVQYNAVSEWCGSMKMMGNVKLRKLMFEGYKKESGRIAKIGEKNNIVYEH